MIKLTRTPSVGELRWFGVVILAALCLLGALLWWQSGSIGVAIWLGGTGAGLSLVYYAMPPLRRVIYSLWMTAVFPIGWLISHILLAAIYYLLFTPVGLVMRISGRDLMRRRFDPSAASYWIEESPSGDPAEYFRQS